MSGTGDSISCPMARSIAPSSAPTARATRSFSRASSGVGAFTGRDWSDPLPEHHPVLDLDLRSRGGLLHLDHRELVPDLDDAARGHLFVELAEQLAGDGMHDGDLVTPHAHRRSR